MQNEDGYEIVPDVIEAVNYGEKFVTFKTSSGTFSLLSCKFCWVPAQGTPVILHIKGRNEVVGLTTKGAKNFYIAPDQYDDYVNLLMGRRTGG